MEMMRISVGADQQIHTFVGSGQTSNLSVQTTEVALYRT